MTTGRFIPSSFDPRIFQSQEIEDAVEADRGDRLAGGGLHLRFGVEGDAESREREHRQVVGAVAYGDRLGDVDVLELAQKPQQLGLAAAVDDLARVASVRRPSTISNSLA